jgi:hypothetical protein
MTDVQLLKRAKEIVAAENHLEGCKKCQFVNDERSGFSAYTICLEAKVMNVFQEF